MQKSETKTLSNSTRKHLNRISKNTCFEQLSVITRHTSQPNVHCSLMPNHVSSPEISGNLTQFHPESCDISLIILLTRDILTHGLLFFISSLSLIWLMSHFGPKIGQLIQSVGRLLESEFHKSCKDCGSICVIALVYRGYLARMASFCSLSLMWVC